MDGGCCRLVVGTGLARELSVTSLLADRESDSGNAAMTGELMSVFSLIRVWFALVDKRYSLSAITDTVRIR